MKDRGMMRAMNPREWLAETLTLLQERGLTASRVTATAYSVEVDGLRPIAEPSRVSPTTEERRRLVPPRA